MKHLNHRWFHRTRVRVDRLEDRLQPGSLLFMGLDITAVAELEAPLELTAEFVNPLSSESIKRVVANDTDQGQTSPTDVSAVLTSAKSSASTSEVQETAPLGSDSSASVTRTQTVAPPAIQLAQSQKLTPPAPTRAINQPSFAGGRMMRHDALPRAVPQPIVHQLDLQARPFDKSLLVEDNRPPTSGGRAADYHTYDGTPAPDAHNAVAGGKGPELGFAYAAGFRGPDGRVTKVDAAGGFIDGLTILGATVNDIATDYDPAEIPFGTEFHNYIVGNLASGESFILRLNQALDPFTAIGVIYTPPSPGSMSFEGVGISLNGGVPDVYISGWVTGLGPPYANMLAISLDDALTLPEIYVSALDFGIDSRGTGVDADRGHNAFHSMVFDTGPSFSPATTRLSPAGLPIWATVFPAGGPAPIGGMFGIKFVGGTSAANGVYSTGIVQSAGNPGMDNLFIAKQTAGGAVTYAFVYTIGGEDFAGLDIVAGRDGSAYTTGYFSSPGGTQGVLNKFSPAGAILPDFDFVGAPGTPDSGLGIDLVEQGMPATDVLGVGMTGTPEGVQHPPPVGFDVTYDGAGDGYILRDNQPLTP